MKIVSIVGARPQFIKCSELSRLLRVEHNEVLVHTGQHYDPNMSNVFFKELDIPKPDYNLEVGSGSHGKQTGQMLELIEAVLTRENPDLVIVYGDTNSTLAGALAASKMHIPVAHVEAGLRSFDKTMPEEINRVLTDHISDLLFCPDTLSVKRLVEEGIRSGVCMTGDVMADALNRMKDHPTDILQRLALKPQDYSVMTIHRPQNTDSARNMETILSCIARYQKTVIFPMHPRTKKSLMNYGFWISMPLNTRTIQPLGYPDMITLMKNADRIITDSGGIQKEAYILGVPCITLRDRTEWTGTLCNGWNLLAGTNPALIINALKAKPSGARKLLFSTGASQKIASLISNWGESCATRQ
jgi:UDP-N-acetylglucosamine 2-epimerase (non-hydrolysing)